MKRVLFVIILLFSGVLSAGDNAWLQSIEDEANLRAKAYSDDIRQISATLLASDISVERSQFNTSIDEIKQKHEEPIAIHLKKVSQVLVFLSFSMPEKSLHSWLLQCKQSGATPVIRGLIHNSFRETMVAIQTLSKKTGVGLQLDPILFKTFDVQIVPAIVHIKDMPPCPANMNCKPVDYDSLYGDVSLDYALEKMRSDDEADNQTINGMIHRLNGKML